MKTKITVAMVMFIGFVLCSTVVAYMPMLIVRECPADLIRAGARPDHVERHPGIHGLGKSAGTDGGSGLQAGESRRSRSSP